MTTKDRKEGANCPACVQLRLLRNQGLSARRMVTLLINFTIRFRTFIHQPPPHPHPLLLEPFSTFCSSMLAAIPSPFIHAKHAMHVSSARIYFSSPSFLRIGVKSERRRSKGGLISCSREGENFAMFGLRFPSPTPSLRRQTRVQGGRNHLLLRN